MSQQHMDRDFVTARVTGGEFRNDVAHGHLQIEFPTFVENHRHRGSGDSLSDGREIEDRLRSHRGGVGLIREMPKGLVGDQLSFQSHGKRSTRESP